MLGRVMASQTAAASLTSFFAALTQHPVRSHKLGSYHTYGVSLLTLKASASQIPQPLSTDPGPTELDLPIVPITLALITQETRLIGRIP